MTPREERLIKRAVNVIERNIKTGEVLSTPALVKDYLRLKLYGLQHEVFSAIFVDTQC